MIKVLVIDDSATMRIMLKKLIDKSELMKCIGVAPNPVAAKDMIRELKPDVITLDIEMPKMDGLEFLERMMRLSPIPVIMISTLTEAGSASALRALELGAIDFIAKPKVDVAEGIEEYAQEIHHKIEVAGGAKVRALTRDVPPIDFDARPPTKPEGVLATAEDRIIAIGASTGGTEALKEILLELPADCPPMLVAQHMPAAFLRSLALRLDLLCSMHVKIAEDGEVLRRGYVYIAPGHSDLKLDKNGDGYVCRLKCETPAPQSKSSIDQLFVSIAETAGDRGIGVVLTGMDSDGAQGARRMIEAGAFTIAQDTQTSVVSSMPEAAMAKRGISEVLPLNEIAERLIKLH
ncbi:protein-glutamate methylesterase/protein-glutamine glutaminase [Burkholderia ubonensis]|uniref:protein-glutamate methylesterase/protein-glutamine glutaminase n=1 Tax=Burkholderia ubonensis TaxID=101571 RepID=UPI00075528C0|nr:chemotaxis response regulator protein-glutamate methylesterase [Burkholderia ubonensis]KWB79391.1 chemotaxis response regulator protein-glutamate methylesterase [Burkholderia ubonensis]